MGRGVGGGGASGNIQNIEYTTSTNLSKKSSSQISCVCTRIIDDVVWIKMNHIHPVVRVC